MAKYLTGILAILAVGLLVVPVRANADTHLPGSLLVHDDAKLFTQPGIDAAKKVLHDTSFDDGLSLRVSTFDYPPENKKAEAEAARKDPAKLNAFMQRWAFEQAPKEGAKGIFVVICRHPGGVGVHVDDTTRDRGFTNADTAKVDEILTKAIRDSYSPDHKDKPESATMRDAGLKSATEYIVTKLKDTTVKHTATTGHPAEKQKPTASPLMGYICLGIVGLLGAWLVIGLIRAFRGGGGGGAGGLGGGGFMTSLFGGLFGAMAGMWLYSNLFGGGGMFGGGSDAFGNGGGGGDGSGTDGTGNYSGDPEAGGYEDSGGGGDWGGGGGDFGGGGGDW